MAEWDSSIYRTEAIIAVSHFYGPTTLPICPDTEKPPGPPIRSVEQLWLKSLAGVIPIQLEERVALELFKLPNNDFKIFVASSRALDPKIEHYLQCIWIAISKIQSASDSGSQTNVVVDELTRLILTHVMPRVRSLLQKCETTFLPLDTSNTELNRIFQNLREQKLSIDDVISIFGWLKNFDGEKVAPIKALSQIKDGIDDLVKYSLDSAFPKISDHDGLQVSTVPQTSKNFKGPGSVEEWQSCIGDLPGAMVGWDDHTEAVEKTMTSLSANKAPIAVHPVLDLHTARSVDVKRNANWYIATSEGVCRACAHFLDACNTYLERNKDPNQPHHDVRFVLFDKSLEEGEPFPFPWVAPPKYDIKTDESMKLGTYFSSYVIKTIRWMNGQAPDMEEPPMLPFQFPEDEDVDEYNARSDEEGELSDDDANNNHNNGTQK